MIFGLFVHPGTQTFFLWQQHAFGSQADSSSDDGEDEAEDEEDVEEDEDSSPRSLWLWRRFFAAAHCRERLLAEQFCKKVGLRLGM